MSIASWNHPALRWCSSFTASVIQHVRRAIHLAQPYPEDELLASQFRAQQLRMLAKHGIATLPTQLGAGTALAWMQAERNPSFFAWWPALLLVLSGAAAWRMARNIHLDTASQTNFRAGMLTIVVAACLWGALPLLSLQGSGAQEQIAILLAMACMTSAGVVVFQNLPVAAIAWVLILVSCTTASMWMQGFAHIVEICIIALLYSAILIRHILMASSDFFSRLYGVHTAQKLSQTLAQQAQIAQGTSNSVLLLDKVGRVTWINNGFSLSSGYSPADAIGHHPLIWLSDQDKAKAIQTLWPTLLKKSAVSTELPYRQKSGQWQWMRLDIKRLTSGGNITASYVIVATDITELKRSAEALKAEQERQSHIIDGTHCGTWEIDFEARVCRMGGHWLDITGLDTTTPLVIEGPFLMDHIHPDDQPGHQAALLRYVRGQSPKYAHEHRLRHEDGSWRWVSARGKASAYSTEGKITQMSGISMDISKSKATELALMEATRQAKQANHAKSLFLATMSHEIRTPMNGVIGTAEWLKFTELDAEQRDGIQTIVDSGRSLLTIIDDILDYTKMEAERMKLEEAPMSLRDLAEAVSDALMPVAEAKHVDLHVFIEPSLPAYVMGDPNRLRQVLFNLLGNALKFGSGTPERRGQVDVQIQPADDGSPSWQLMVSDDGIGMKPETLDRLFTPFTQAEASTTRRFGGTGLGLAICRRLVELMGGGIVAHSVPGHGATFTVTLPLHTPNDLAQSHSSIDLTGVDCLLLPGRNYRSDTFLAYLEHAGACVHHCQSEADVATLAEGKPLVVVIRDTPEDAQASHHSSTDQRHAEQIRYLLVGRYQHGPARIVANQTGQLGRAHEQDLLRAVAVLAGRQSPETAPSPLDEFDEFCTAMRRDGSRSNLAQRLILVAEDDTTNQRVIKRQLQMLGFACELANNGQEALTLWRTGRFDILLSDLHMPEIDGYELTRQIRAEEAELGDRCIPIVALTANALLSEKTRALACGMSEYLTKPVSPKDLHRCLKQWLPTAVMDAPVQTPLPGKPERPHPDSPCLDIDVLRALVGDDEDVIQELLLDFDTSSRKQGHALAQAIASSAYDRIGQIAHQLKSSARSVGAHRLARLCEDAEKCARTQDASMASCHELMRELQQVHEHLASLIGEAIP